MPKDEIVREKNELVPVSDSGVLIGVDLKTAMAGKSATEKMAALREVTSYVGAQTEKIDNYLGQRLLLKGLVLQNATVRLQVPTTDPITGEINEYGEAERVVVKFDPGDGKEHMVSFVSLAVASFAKNFLIPLFGMGDFKEDGKSISIPIIVRQTSNARGRTYNMQVIE